MRDHLFPIRFASEMQFGLGAGGLLLFLLENLPILRVGLCKNGECGMIKTVQRGAVLQLFCKKILQDKYIMQNALILYEYQIYGRLDRQP